MRESLKENLFIHLKKFAKTNNKRQIFVLQTEPFIKDFVYADVNADDDSLNTDQQTQLILNNILTIMRLDFFPAAGYWLKDTTLPSIKYLKEELNWSIIDDDKFLLIGNHEVSINYKSIFPMQFFKVYTNAEPIMQKNVICNDK